MKKLISLTLILSILVMGVAFADPGNVIRASVYIRSDHDYIHTLGYIVNDEEVYIPLTAAIMVLQKDALPLPADDQLLGGEDGLIYAPFVSFATERGYKVTRDFAKEATLDAFRAKIAQLPPPFGAPFIKSVILKVTK